MNWQKPFVHAYHKTCVWQNHAFILVCPYQRPDTKNFAVNKVEVEMFNLRMLGQGLRPMIRWQHEELRFCEDMPYENLVPGKSVGRGFMLYSIPDVEEMEMSNGNHKC